MYRMAHSIRPVCEEIGTLIQFLWYFNSSRSSGVKPCLQNSWHINLKRSIIMTAIKWTPTIYRFTLWYNQTEAKTTNKLCNRTLQRCDVSSRCRSETFEPTVTLRHHITFSWIFTTWNTTIRVRNRKMKYHSEILYWKIVKFISCRHQSPQNVIAAKIWTSQNDLFDWLIRAHCNEAIVNFHFRDWNDDNCHKLISEVRNSYLVYVYWQHILHTCYSTKCLTCK